MAKLKPELITKSSNSRLHGCGIPVIGLTGGIASGKSTAAKYLMEKGFKVINADVLIKSIYAENETIKYVESNWPQVIVESKIDFKALRKLFFSDNEIQKNLESFLYQKMPEKFLSHIDDSDELIIYDVPLLFEKGLDKLVDLSVCVYCTKENQIIRLTKRDDIDNELAESIINNQLAIDIKSQKSNFIINNNTDEKNLLANIDSFLAKILS